jgi:hypothetical protein
MLTGVEILLERMKTNPEEFIEGGFSKWSRVINSAWDILTEQERKALEDGTKEAKRDHFNGEVMRVLAQGHDDIEETLKYKASERYTTGWNDPRSLLTPEVMREQVKDALDKQFDEAYARKDKQAMNSASKLKNAMRK